MYNLLVTVVILLVNNVYTQQIIGHPCTVESSNSPGVCKVLTECKQIRDDVVFANKLPQTCGFQGTQVIVCCPKFRQPGDISKTKCREYSSNIKDKRECRHKIVKRIVGGLPAGRTEFPHMAKLGFQQDNGHLRWLCGGSLISEQYILTAAQCTYSILHGPANVVLLGVINLNDTSHRQEVKIVERIVHTEYKPPSSYHDIALLKLEKPVEVNSYVRPACLHTNSQVNTAKAVATGWGLTSYAGEESNDLIKVTLDIADHQFCNNNYTTSRRLNMGIVDDIQVCTYSTEGKDTCQGDTGGPLQIPHNSDDVMCMYDIVGVTSFGKGCSRAPSVSTRVSYYVKWIEDIVWPENTL